MVSTDSRSATFEQVETALVQAQAKLNSLGKVHESFKEASAAIGEAATALRHLAASAAAERREYAGLLTELRAAVTTLADAGRSAAEPALGADVAGHMDELRADLAVIRSEVGDVTGRLAAIELQTSRPVEVPSVDLTPVQGELATLGAALERLESRLDEHDDKAAAQAKRLTSHVTTKTDKAAAQVVEHVEVVQASVTVVQADLRQGLAALARRVEAPKAPKHVTQPVVEVAAPPATQGTDVLPQRESRFRRRK